MGKGKERRKKKERKGASAKYGIRKLFLAFWVSRTTCTKIQK